MKSFVEYHPEQMLMLPPSLEEWLPEDHLARFIAEVSVELDLREVMASYEGDGRGQAAYHPLMMVRLLLYGYCVGMVSSRVIERKTYEDVAFRYLACNQHPDHATVSEFRRRHRKGLEHLFVKVLLLCQAAGLVKLGQVSLDGTKMKANASLHATQRYAALEAQEEKLAAQVQEMLAEAERADAAEDQKYGRGRRGDELPEDFRSKQRRLERIREGKARLEQQARQRAEEEKQKRVGRETPEAPAENMGAAPPHEAKPTAEQKINLTDADSRTMRDRSSLGWVQGYNVQAAVDGAAQIIVAADVTQDQNDRKHLCPMVEQVEQNLGARPEKVSADTDYWSPSQVASPIVEGIDLYIRPEDPPPAVRRVERTDEQGAPMRKWKPRSGYTAEGLSRADAMRMKLKTTEGRAVYAQRREIVEPVFGQIKQRRGLRQFLFRGVERVQSEWKLICLTHNLLKLYRYGWLASRAT